MESSLKPDRRDFLTRTALAAGGLVTATTLGMLRSHMAWASERATLRRGWSDSGRLAAGYGALRRVADQDGREILALPQGFGYVTFGRIGEPMSDGQVTPRNHDGMTSLPRRDGVVRLIRNHELRNAAGDFTLAVTGPVSTRYDPRGMGGCVTLDFDTAGRRLVRDFISLNGTIVNCSGGLAYENSGWLSCEECVYGPERGFARPHGYTFFVPGDLEAPVPARPIVAMGRFAKEAAVADNASGIVYQTEDDGGASGFYRFLPEDPRNLFAGGVLQMLAVRGAPNYDARSRQTVGAALPVHWVTIGQPDPDPLAAGNRVFTQGARKGGARFRRLEGVFRGEDGSVYFVSTTGGNAGFGQVWRYVPEGASDGTLVLEFESPAGSVLDSPDNLCVTPRGGILLCEDDATGRDGAPHPVAPGMTQVNRLIGLSREGGPFEFAVNLLNSSEFAGACFSPDGETLFVNIFGDGRTGSGMTCAVWGPWQQGPL